MHNQKCGQYSTLAPKLFALMSTFNVYCTELSMWIWSSQSLFCKVTGYSLNIQGCWKQFLLDSVCDCKELWPSWIYHHLWSVSFPLTLTLNNEIHHKKIWQYTKTSKNSSFVIALQRRLVDSYATISAMAIISSNSYEFCWSSSGCKILIL